MTALAVCALRSGSTCRKRRVGTQAESLASHCLKAWDDDIDEELSGEGDDLIKVKLIVKGKEHEYSAGMSKQALLKSSLARRAADHVRSKVGLMRDTEANRLVARRLVADYLDGVKDLRLSHRKVIEPVAVLLALTPTDTDVLVGDMAASVAFSRRREQHDATRVSEYNPWWSFLPGLGGFRRRYERGPLGA